LKEKKSFYNLDVTLEQAIKDFSSKDPGSISLHADVNYCEKENEFVVPFLNRSYTVSYPEGKIRDSEGNPLSSYLSIIILHYLVAANGKPLTGSWVSYRHLPGGDIYIDPFTKRAVNPFLKQFGQQPDLFVKAAKALGGREEKASGISMVLPVMPRIPICFTIWPGDDEFPATATILFDEAASSYLPTEDYAHLPAMITGEMKKALES